jgi:hypothetical protein
MHNFVFLGQKRPTRVILENHGCKFTHSRETAIKPTCVCVCVCCLTLHFPLHLSHQTPSHIMHRFDFTMLKTHRQDVDYVLVSVLGSFSPFGRGNVGWRNVWKGRGPDSLRPLGDKIMAPLLYMT